jgi:cell division protein FtsL
MTARQQAQRQLDAATGDKQRLEFQKAQLDKRSRLYAIRAEGINMQIAEADKEIEAAHAALRDAVRAEGDK